MKKLPKTKKKLHIHITGDFVMAESFVHTETFESPLLYSDSVAAEIHKKITSHNIEK